VKKYGRAGRATDDNMIRRMLTACWIPKATNQHSEYVTPIASTLRQRWQERASMLRYTYVACLVRKYKLFMFCSLVISSLSFYSMF